MHVDFNRVIIGQFLDFEGKNGLKLQTFRASFDPKAAILWKSV